MIRLKGRSKRREKKQQVERWQNAGNWERLQYNTVGSKIYAVYTEATPIGLFPYGGACLLLLPPPRGTGIYFLFQPVLLRALLGPANQASFGCYPTNRGKYGAIPPGEPQHLCGLRKQIRGGICALFWELFLPRLLVCMVGRIVNRTGGRRMKTSRELVKCPVCGGTGNLGRDKYYAPCFKCDHGYVLAVVERKD